MKRFLAFLLKLVLSLLLLMMPPISVFLMTGEVQPFKNYIKPLEDGQLFGLAYFGNERAYKFYMTEDKKPDILIMGGSRSMKITEKSFSPDYSFYNIGPAVQNLMDYYTFVHKLDYNPKLIVADITQFWFNANRKPTPPGDFEVPSFDLPLFLSSCFGFYRDCISGKIKLSHLNDNSNIGIAGRCKYDGFTDNGCYNYGSYLNNPSKSPDYNFHDTYSRIEHHNRRFEKCDSINKNVIIYIEQFLKECKQRNIKVLAIIPPFAPKVIEKMEADGNYYGLLHGIYDEILGLFDFENSYLYDYTDVTFLGAPDEDFADGYHAGESIHYLIFQDIMQKGCGLSDYFVTPQKLDSLYQDYQRKGISYHHFK